MKLTELKLTFCVPKYKIDPSLKMQFSQTDKIQNAEQNLKST
jgi:hypothetical protein